MKCTKCNIELNSEAKFCSQCGLECNSNLSDTSNCSSCVFSKPSSKSFISILLIAAVITLGVMALNKDMLGEKPTEKYVASSTNSSIPEHSARGGATEYKDPDILRLKRAVKASPDDKKSWKALAMSLSEKMKNGQLEPRKAALDLVDALSNILRIDDVDKEALLLTADLSFDMKAFPKAKEFYERYLKLNPEDHSASARYASVLTFLGKYKESLAILNTVLEKDPKNFQAHAFLSITYAQRGDMKTALAKGENALQYAPSEEAKTRFEKYLASLSTEKKNEAPLLVALRKNPIAGPKIVELIPEGTTLKAKMRFFPMDKMPEVAKNKFLSSLKKNRGNFQKIIFLDNENGKTLAEFKLND